MPHPVLRRAVIPIVAVAAMLVTTVAVPAQARESAPGGSVAAITDRVARQLADALARPATKASVFSTLARDATVDVAGIAVGRSFAESIAAANRSVALAKGLPPSSGSLLQVRLGHHQMTGAVHRGATPLVAAAPTDDTVASLIAYSPDGGRMRLDPSRIPARPVLIVEVDVAKAMPIGLAIMRHRLDAAGVRMATSAPKPQAAGGYWATKLDAIRVEDDQEPWFKGDAEIYNIAGGFGTDGVAKVDIVQMPYLNRDQVTYYPNQLLVHFDNYKYDLADVVLMEDDGDTNYLQLAQALAAVLLTVLDQGVYIPLVNAILAALPSSWWTDDPDYVASWYTLGTTTADARKDASGNGWADFSPHWVSEL